MGTKSPSTRQYSRQLGSSCDRFSYYYLSGIASAGFLRDLEVLGVNSKTYYLAAVLVFFLFLCFLSIVGRVTVEWTV